LQLLNEISRELSSVLVLGELLRKIGTLTKKLVDYHRFGILLTDEKTETFNAVISLKQDERMPERSTVNFGQGIVGAAATTRRPVVVGDVSKDPRYINVNPETRSEMTVPLIYRDRVIGVIDLESPNLNYFNDEHVRIFSTLAPQIAITIENARLYERVARSEARLERDLRRAQEIQMHLMPGIAPKIPGIDAALHFQPSSELGGDLYEFLSYGRDRHAIVVGDVSGKGAPAALYGAMASGTLRSLAPLKLLAPDMMKQLNVMFLERKIEGHFITLTYAIWEPRTKVLTLANAGMPLPILLRKGQCRAIRVEGVPLGLLEHTEYQPVTVNLESGDLLALFSDGINEANDLQQEEFGMRRIESILRENAQKPPQEIVNRVFQEIKTFEAGRPARDDQTLVILKVK
jgi:phosphoserine phosphatase RsbU/P